MPLKPPVSKYRRYADYYDLFYKKKNYQKEVTFLEKIFNKYSKSPIISILDLGCGLGGHSLILAKRGYEIVGVDLSSKLIRLGQKKVKKHKLNANFLKGDIRNIDLGRKFDAAIAMFNVVGYQVRNEDFKRMVKTANRHVKKEGLFVFDCWFGPAVLFQKPDNWLKIFKEGRERVIKFTQPTLDKKNKVVNLKYMVFRVFGKKILDEFEEQHILRFFFPKEIKQFLKRERFKILKIAPLFDLNKTPTVNDWNVIVISRKI